MEYNYCLEIWSVPGLISMEEKVQEGENNEHLRLVTTRGQDTAGVTTPAQESVFPDT